PRDCGAPAPLLGFFPLLHTLVFLLWFSACVTPCPPAPGILTRPLAPNARLSTSMASAAFLTTRWGVTGGKPGGTAATRARGAGRAAGRGGRAGRAVRGTRFALAGRRAGFLPLFAFFMAPCPFGGWGSAGAPAAVDDADGLALRARDLSDRQP